MLSAVTNTVEAIRNIAYLFAHVAGRCEAISPDIDVGIAHQFLSAPAASLATWDAATMLAAVQEPPLPEPSTFARILDDAEVPTC